MRVTCEHCAQALAIPDEKVPNRAFSLTCPKCKGTIKVDPTAAPPAPAASAPAPASGFAPKASPTPAPPPGLDVSDFTPLHALRPTEQALLDQVVPLVFLVGVTDAGEDQRVTAGLGRLGWDTIERHASPEDAVRAMAAAAPGIMIVRRDQRVAPPDFELAPLSTLTPELRRSIFVAVLAEGVHALDGQLAFLLQVDCVLDADALYRFPADLRRAVLVRQQRYRHWHLDNDL